MGLSLVHRSVAVEGPGLASTIEDGALHNSKSQTGTNLMNIHTGPIDRIGT